MIDTVLAVGVLVFSVASAYWFVRWDRRMEDRHIEKLNEEIAEIVRKRDG